MTLDQQQIIIANKLNEIANYLNNTNIDQPKIKFIKKFFKSKKILFKSVYIYGGVGTGKTMLMKEFYQQLLTKQKFYIHFNSFMYKIHQALHLVRTNEIKNNDQVNTAIKNVLINNFHDNKLPKIICFDEFQVNDVADAMLLSKIFSFFFDQKIMVIITSNIYPRNLYQNGLQRELFLKFVDQILIPNCEIFKLDNGIDYRKISNKLSLKKFLIEDQENIILFNNYLQDFTKNKIKNNISISVWGRDLKINECYEDIALFTSNQLFYQDLHSADYHEICQKFNLIMIKNLDYFKEDDVNEIRRFTLFIDEVYESKISLIILSKVNIDELLNHQLIEKKFSFFLRTISRLKEIKSQNYWQNSKFIKNS